MKRLIGIKTRTQNDGKAMVDIPALWGKFMNPATQSMIQEKMSAEIYCVYTEYDSDHTGPYTVFIGYAVSESAILPESFHEMRLAKGNYKSYTAKGNLQEGAVFNAWKNIWSEDIERSYITDYEVYGEKAMNPLDAEVEIYIGIK